MEKTTWLLLSYQLPAHPSKSRVYVWRKLKDLGATYFRQGVAMLPLSLGSLEKFRVLADKIVSMSGEATIAELKYISKKDEQKAVSEFVLRSRKEYQKIIREIDQLYALPPKSKQEALEQGEKAKKLEKKLLAIRGRDYFMSSREPELNSKFGQLLRDMSSATSNLTKHISSIISG